MQLSQNLIFTNNQITFFSLLFLLPSRSQRYLKISFLITVIKLLDVRNELINMFRERDGGF